MVAVIGRLRVEAGDGLGGLDFNNSIDCLFLSTRTWVPGGLHLESRSVLDWRTPCAAVSADELGLYSTVVFPKASEIGLDFLLGRIIMLARMSL